MEILSSMNHPDGDCPLCLYPLVREEKNASALPFMKLMSCFHCFHWLILFHFCSIYCKFKHALTDVFIYFLFYSECFFRWWRWLQAQSGTNQAEEPTVTAGNQRGNISILSRDFKYLVLCFYSVLNHSPLIHLQVHKLL